MAPYPGAYPRRRGSGLFVVIYLLFGVYLLNYTLKFVAIPAGVSSSIDKWIILAGGILLIFGAFNLLRLNRYRSY